MQIDFIYSLSELFYWTVPCVQVCICGCSLSCWHFLFWKWTTAQRHTLKLGPEQPQFFFFFKLFKISNMSLNVRYTRNVQENRGKGEERREVEMFSNEEHQTDLGSQTASKSEIFNILIIHYESPFTTRHYQMSLCCNMVLLWGQMTLFLSKTDKMSDKYSTEGHFKRQTSFIESVYLSL